MPSERYLNDGKPALKLNQLQASTKEVANIKVKENIYQSEDTYCAICIEYQHFFRRLMQVRSSWFFLFLMLPIMMFLSHASMAGAADNNQHTIASQAWEADPATRLLQDNWKELKKRNLRLLPVPKRISFEQNPVILSGDGEQEVVIVVDTQSARSDVAVNEIQSRMDDFSRHLEKKFTVSSTKKAGAYNIVIENHWPNTFTKDQPEDSALTKTDQAYGIYPQKDGIILSGRGEMGMMYAAVTLRYLMTEKNGKVILFPANILDWPDYKHRQLGQFQSLYHMHHVSNRNAYAHLKQMKKYMDWMFRMKGNAVFRHTTGHKVFSSKPDTLPVAEKEMKMANVVSEYASIRGIRTMHNGKVMLGKVGVDDDRPGFRDMMLDKRRGNYHSWARHDLHKNKAANMSEFLRRSGFDMAFIHAVDAGGIADPEMWSKRDPLTLEKYGNNRAQADIDMFNIYVQEFSKRNKEVVLVAYPYSAGYLDPSITMKSLRLADTPSAQKRASNAINELKSWMSEINAAIDPSVRMCVREDSRDRLSAYFDMYQGRPMWIYWETAHYTRSIRPLIASSVRSLGSGYFEAQQDDMIWVNTLDYQWFDEQIQVTGAEFSWNTKFPGWSDYEPAYRMSGGVQVDDQEALDILAERAAVGLWGDEAGQYMKEVFNGHMSWKVAVDPYETTKKPNRSIVPDLIERNQQAVDRAVRAMDDLWNHHREQQALGRKIFDDFSYPYFIQYRAMTKAAKAYADMNQFTIMIQSLVGDGRIEDAKALRLLALQQADSNEAQYKLTIKEMDDEPWVYRDYINRQKYPQWQLMAPDFSAIRRELQELKI